MAAFLKHWKHPRRRWDEGATAVEAALILPVFFLMIFGIIEFGTVFWQWNTMLLAVEQAGRYAMVNNASCDMSCAESQMKAILTSASSSCSGSPAAGQICVSAVCSNPSTCTPTTSSTTMTLTAAYGYNIFGLAGPYTISSQGTVPLD
jgi:Flp pilus assembly protein TadG